MTSRHTKPHHLVAGFLVTCSLAACGNSPRGPQPLTVKSVTAISNTTVRVTYSEAVTPDAATPARYSIRGTDGTHLGILAAYPEPSGTAVTLATRAQGATTYTLSATGVTAQQASTPALVTAPVTFAPSTHRSALLGSAVPTDNTHVLLAFTTPTGTPVELAPNAEDVRAYSIPNLTVLNAKLTVDRSSVLLTTAPQNTTPYEVTVSHVSDAGNVLIDHAFRTATFRGSNGPDTTPPRVSSLAVLNDKTVLLSFTEPLRDTALDATRYAITDAGDAPLAVTHVSANEFRTQFTLTTAPQLPGAPYTLNLAGLTDKAGNALDPSTVTHAFTGSVRSGTPGADTAPLKVAGVAATSSTSVLVTFTKAVRGGPAGAENPAHYRVTGAGAVMHATVRASIPQLPLMPSSTLSVNSITPHVATLNILSATLMPNGRSVLLTTREQSDIKYLLQVVNVTDVDGQAIQPPDQRDNPDSVTFVGMAASGTPADTDEDGVSDAAEQRGWVVSVRRQDGTLAKREVTSDPTKADTDADGVSDLDEVTYLLDPRHADTDADQLSDWTELNRTYSTPFDQDSDRDGLADGLERNFFKTSPILADTDGDQFNDADEVTSGNRDPRRADLPRLQIKIGDVALTLDEAYTYTNSSGQSVTVTDSSSSTLEQGNERRYGTSDSSTLTTAIEASVKTGVNATFPDGFGANVETEFKGSEQREYNTTTSRESAVTATQTYNTSIEKAQAFDTTSEVTRTINGAAMRLMVTLNNDSNVSYTVQNLEITALEQNPMDRSRFTPVATLVAEAGSVTGANPSYNLSPLIPELGPFIFKNSTVFPRTIENLLREPHGLVFRVANYDITDEDGRNFAFASREAYDRTAEIVIDYGDGRVQRHRVATTSDFDDTGKATGITMKYALQDILNVDYATGTVGYAPGQVLTRVGNVSNQPGSHKAWTLLTPIKLPTGVNFDDIVLRAGDSISIAYLEDVDQDGLLANEEYLYGSSDACTNSDGATCASAAGSTHDTLTDFAEVRTGWLVNIVGRTPYRAFSDPRSADSDNDGILDHEEQQRGTDPRKRDTDEDGLSDWDEVRGFTMRYKDAATPTSGVTTNPLNPDTDGDGFRDGFERKIGSNPNVPDARKFMDSDQDGVSDHDESTGFTTTVNGASVAVTSYNDDDDSDNDGLPDLLEHMLKTNPLSNDTDGDGLTDHDEFKPSTFDGYNTFTQACSAVKNCQYAPPASTGRLPYGTSLVKRDTDADGLDDKTEVTTTWTVSIKDESGATQTRTVASDATLADADRDGWNDHTERTAGTDPNRDDTDGDGSKDNAESTRCAGSTCTSPLVMDQLVTVTYRSILVRSDGDHGGNPGDFKFQMRSSAPAQDGDNGDIIVNSSTTGLVSDCTSGQGPAPCRYSDSAGVQIAISSGQEVTLNRSRSYVKAYSVPLATYFWLQEIDDGAQFTMRQGYRYNGRITPGDANTGDFSHRSEDREWNYGAADYDDFDVEVKLSVTVR